MLVANASIREIIIIYMLVKSLSLKENQLMKSLLKMMKLGMKNYQSCIIALCSMTQI